MPWLRRYDYMPYYAGNPLRSRLRGAGALKFAGTFAAGVVFASIALGVWSTFSSETPASPSRPSTATKANPPVSGPQTASAKPTQTSVSCDQQTWPYLSGSCRQSSKPASPSTHQRKRQIRVVSTDRDAPAIANIPIGSTAPDRAATVTPSPASAPTHTQETNAAAATTKPAQSSAALPVRPAVNNVTPLQHEPTRVADTAKPDTAPAPTARPQRDAMSSAKERTESVDNAPPKRVANTARVEDRPAQQTPRTSNRVNDGSNVQQSKPPAKASAKRLATNKPLQLHSKSRSVDERSRGYSRSAKLVQRDSDDVPAGGVIVRRSYRLPDGRRVTVTRMYPRGASPSPRERATRDHRRFVLYGAPVEALMDRGTLGSGPADDDDDLP